MSLSAYEDSAVLTFQPSHVKKKEKKKKKDASILFECKAFTLNVKILYQLLATLK